MSGPQEIMQPRQSQRQGIETSIGHRHAIPDDAHLLAGHAGQYVGEKAWDARLMSREKLVLNGMYLDEIQAPKPEFRDQAEQGT